MDSFAWILAGLWTFGASLQTFGTLRLVARRSQKRARTEEGFFQASESRARPGLSILKPLKGRDESLEENLRTFFKLDYPEFELLFAMESPDDPAFPAVQKVASEFPQVSHRLFFSGTPKGGTNPKIGNLEGAYRSALYDLILISDSNVRITNETLESFVSASHLPGVGMVSGVVRGDRPRTFAGELEAVYLNTFYARGMMLADAVGKTAVVGKAMLFRRSVLSRLGGLNALGLYLAEDYMAGVGLKYLGYAVALANAPVSQVIGRYRFQDFWKRHIRWGRIRKAQAPVVFLLEPIAQSLFLAFVGANLFQRFGFSFHGAFAAQVGFFFFLDFVLQARLGVRANFRTVFAWIVRECLAPVLWVATLSGNTVDWRGKSLTVVNGGILRSLEEVL